jgi:hypothetical protein
MEASAHPGVLRGPLPAPRRASPLDFLRCGKHDALVAFAVAVAAAVFLATVPVAFGVDSWLALANGREIWQYGLPHHDALILMSHGGMWLDQQWLAHLAMYGVYELGGLGLLGALDFALIAGGLAGAVLAARKLGVGPRTVLALLPVCAWLMIFSHEVRTQSFAYPLFGLTVYLLAADSRCSSRRVYWCLALLVVWANLHGSAILGAGLIALRGLTLAWERRGELRSTVAAWRRPLALTFGAPLCLLATPYGTSMLSYYHVTLMNSEFKHAILEWQPVTSAPFLAAPFFVLAALALWSFGRHGGRVTVWEQVGLLALAACGIDAVRNVVFFTLAALPIVGLSIDAALQNRRGERKALPHARLNRALAVAACTGLALGTLAVSTLPARAFEPRSLTRVARVVSAAAKNRSLRVFASNRFADFLLWKDPSLRGRLAYDSRFEILTPAALRLLQRLLVESGPEWRTATRGYRLLVLDRGSEPRAVTQFLAESGSTVLYDSGGAVVILRSATAASAGSQA